MIQRYSESPLKKVRSRENAFSIQNDINMLNAWSEKWLTSLWAKGYITHLIPLKQETAKKFFGQKLRNIGICLRIFPGFLWHFSRFLRGIFRVIYPSVKTLK